MCPIAVATRWLTGNLGIPGSDDCRRVGPSRRVVGDLQLGCPQFPGAPPLHTAPPSGLHQHQHHHTYRYTCARDALPDHHVGHGAVLLHHQTRLCDASVREHAAARRQTQNSPLAAITSTNAYILKPAVYQHHYLPCPPHPLLPIHPSRPCFYASANTIPLSDQVPQLSISSLSLSRLSFDRSTKQRNRYIFSVTGCAVFSAIDRTIRTGPTATPSRPRSPPLLRLHTTGARQRARDTLSVDLITTFLCWVEPCAVQSRHGQLF